MSGQFANRQDGRGSSPLDRFKGRARGSHGSLRDFQLTFIVIVVGGTMPFSRSAFRFSISSARALLMRRFCSGRTPVLAIVSVMSFSRMSWGICPAYEARGSLRSCVNNPLSSCNVAVARPFALSSQLGTKRFQAEQDHQPSDSRSSRCRNGSSDYPRASERNRPHLAAMSKRTSVLVRTCPQASPR